MAGKRINSCQKGKREERAARDAWRAAGIDARRGRQFSGSPDSPDVITGIDSIHVEVKGCEVTDIYGWLDQAQRDVEKDVIRTGSLAQRLPIVQHRKKRKPWVIILTFDNFIRLLRETNRIRESRPPTQQGREQDNQNGKANEQTTQGSPQDIIRNPQ